MLAIVWTVVQRAHQPQITADRAREARQIGGEIEPLEMLLGEALASLSRIEAESVDVAAYSQYLSQPESAWELLNVSEAMNMCRRSNAFRPHLILNFVRAHNATQSAVGAVRQVRVVSGRTGVLNPAWMRDSVPRAIDQLKR